MNFDSGNACWTLEDPVRALEQLAPVVATTSLRDTMVWEPPAAGDTPGGVTCQWTAMGEGCTDVAAFFDRFEPPAGEARAAVEREYQLGELARSIAYCRDVLGLGLRT